MRIFNRNSIPLDERVIVWTAGRGQTNALDLSEGLNVGAGSIYPALHRLEQAGKIFSVLEPVDRDDPSRARRRLYAVRK